MKRFISFSALALSWASGANAADWYYVTDTKDNSVIYIDKSAVRQQVDVYRDNLTIAWFKWDHSKDSTTENDSSKELYHFKCDKFEMKLIQFITYDDAGKVKTSVSAKAYQEFEVAAPETIGYSMLEAACFPK
jgi:hypothetical protein